MNATKTQITHEEVKAIMEAIRSVADQAPTAKLSNWWDSAAEVIAWELDVWDRYDQNENRDSDRRSAAAASLPVGRYLTDYVREIRGGFKKWRAISPETLPGIAAPLLDTPGSMPDVISATTHYLSTVG